MAGYLDQPIEENRRWAPLIMAEPPRNIAEWQLLGPHGEADRKKYLAMAEAEEARHRQSSESSKAA